MAYSHVTYTGDGTNTIFNIPFPFLKREFITVSINGVKQPPEDMEWLNDTSIRVAKAPPAGSSVMIFRDTAKDKAVVDFRDGSILTERALDDQIAQLLHITQEVYDVPGQLESTLEGIESTAHEAAEQAKLAGEQALLAQEEADRAANTAAQAVAAATANIVNATTAQADAAASSAAAAAQSAIDAASAVPENLVQRVTDVESATSAAQSTANTAKAVTDTVTPTPTAYAVPKAGADGKINKNWLSLDPPYNPYPSLSGTASFVGATNTITMSNIVSTLSLEVGDVIAFGGDANTNNKRLRTVEGVLNDNTIVVNYEHCGNRGNGSRKLSDQSGVSVTCTRIAKWYSAPDSLGRSWIVLPASLRATDTTYTNSTGRPFFMTRMTTNSAGTSLWIDGVIISGAVYANGGMNTASAVITSGSTYKTNGTLYVWAELR